ncbi:ATP-binding domain-containing protein [Neptunicella sp. SCSIO 80796]|uniref:ATP-binding domain-containing protein n=1 Tax=Neptunicella plasticusilytica TaxID=3117012 RepID=UPI003A4DB5C9
MTEMDFIPLAEDTLERFSEISDVASQQYNSPKIGNADSFATGNTLTGGAAFQNLSEIQQGQRTNLKSLIDEPAIVRMVLEGENGLQRIIYIARNSNLTLPSGVEFASYRSPIGRLAELPLGEEAQVPNAVQPQSYVVKEKTSFSPVKDQDGWDSRQTVYRHEDRPTYTIASLRSLLTKRDFSSDDELDKLLEKADTEVVVAVGLTHQVRTAMELRDQPILDKFQGEIFRLPLNSQMMIMGPPGTGKTTTLIKRLGQKLDLGSLEQAERLIATEDHGNHLHTNSWLMFTPSELLKHYLKEAFSREQVPAGDVHIRTWASFRNDIARNTLGLLRSANGGRFILKEDLNSLSEPVIEDARHWYEALSSFHEQRLRKQLIDGRDIVNTSATDKQLHIIQLIEKIAINLAASPLIDIYSSLSRIEEPLREALTEIKAVADALIKRERNRLFNQDKSIFERLSSHLQTMQLDEVDDEDEFDDDEQESISAVNATQIGVKAYVAALRVLARTRYLKRSVAKASRANVVLEFLGDKVPSKEVLLDIGRHISLQNGLRRFVNSHKRYINDVGVSYRQFRKGTERTFYTDEVINRDQINAFELDGMILLTLKNARKLASQTFVNRALQETRFSYLMNVLELFRNQIMVDEATDFSVLELACMANLSSVKTNSFFACGDFNQRITSTGIRNDEQLKWILPSLNTKNIKTVYRQSRKLNSLAKDLLQIFGGDMSALGEVPEESNHNGVNPALLENADKVKLVEWIADRIKEVEKSVRQLPTIAVLVNSESEVKPMAEALSQCLTDVSLNAVACERGQSLGEGSDVRVFDIQHIKGLEFEAVFFAGIDQLAESLPILYERYLYVGATRAATYLGLACRDQLPTKLTSLKDKFVSNWRQ